jgi:hypothetical protein
MAELYRVRYDGDPTGPRLPMVMKVPRMGGGEGAENLVGFEVEHQMLQVLHGPHVPRFVAAGDMGRLPFLVMEYVQGRTLQEILDEATAARSRPPVGTLRAGAARSRWPRTACTCRTRCTWT